MTTVSSPRQPASPTVNPPSRPADPDTARHLHNTMTPPPQTSTRVSSTPQHTAEDAHATPAEEQPASPEPGTRRSKRARSDSRDNAPLKKTKLAQAQEADSRLATGAAMLDFDNIGHEAPRRRNPRSGRRIASQEKVPRQQATRKSAEQLPEPKPQAKGRKANSTGGLPTGEFSIAVQTVEISESIRVSTASTVEDNVDEGKDAGVGKFSEPEEGRNSKDPERPLETTEQETEVAVEKQDEEGDGGEEEVEKENGGGNIDEEEGGDRKERGETTEAKQEQELVRSRRIREAKRHSPQVTKRTRKDQRGGGEDRESVMDQLLLNAVTSRPSIGDEEVDSAGWAKKTDSAAGNRSAIETVSNGSEDGEASQATNTRVSSTRNRTGLRPRGDSVSSEDDYFFNQSKQVYRKPGDSIKNTPTWVRKRTKSPELLVEGSNDADEVDDDDEGGEDEVNEADGIEVVVIHGREPSPALQINSASGSPEAEEPNEDDESLYDDKTPPIPTDDDEEGEEVATRGRPHKQRASETTAKSSKGSKKQCPIRANSVGPSRASRPSFAAAAEYQQERRREAFSEDPEDLPNVLSFLKDGIAESVKGAQQYQDELCKIMTLQRELSQMQQRNSAQEEERGYYHHLDEVLTATRDGEYGPETEGMVLRHLDKVLEQIQELRKRDKQIEEAHRQIAKRHSIKAVNHRKCEDSIGLFLKQKGYPSANVVGGERWAEERMSRQRKEARVSISGGRKQTQQTPSLTTRNSKSRNFIPPSNPRISTVSSNPRMSTASSNPRISTASSNPRISTASSNPRVSDYSFNPSNSIASKSRNSTATQHSVYEDFAADFTSSPHEPVDHTTTETAPRSPTPRSLTPIQRVTVEGFGMRTYPHTPSAPSATSIPWTTSETGALITGLEEYSGPDKFVRIKDAYPHALRSRSVRDLESRAALLATVIQPPPTPAINKSSSPHVFEDHPWTDAEMQALLVGMEELAGVRDRWVCIKEMKAEELRDRSVEDLEAKAKEMRSILVEAGTELQGWWDGF